MYKYIYTYTYIYIYVYIQLFRPNQKGPICTYIRILFGLDGTILYGPAPYCLGQDEGSHVYMYTNSKCIYLHIDVYVFIYI